jgi:Ca-activated chloride channel homolog
MKRTLKTKMNMKKLRFFTALLIVGISVCFVGYSQRKISGIVTDTDTQQPMPGVTVKIKSTLFGTTTDAKGHYEINIPHWSSQLVFSFVGYESIEKSLAATDSILNIKLKSLPQISLQEVVVSGYSVKTKKEITGSVSAAVYGVAAPAGARFHQQPPKNNTENYSTIDENGFKTVKNQAVSTFSSDVDRASYSNTRRFINTGQVPPRDAVRVEEFINYFDYNYSQPKDNQPVAFETQLSDSPWNKGLKLLHIGLQAKTIPTDNLPASNLVFLIDVSGSMNDENKLPLVKVGLKLLIDQLRPSDHVAIVVYAGAAGLVLPPTAGDDKEAIKDALERLGAGGSTAGGAGIELAYETAQKHFIKNGNNRVILATDGDFNVGVSSDAELQRIIEQKREGGVFLSVLGFGMGNYKDNKLEILADKGNGNYGYIDNLQEAQKTFVHEFGGTLFTVAKDVKLQLEFNPKFVAGYRLVGYENRVLNNEDFDNDKKDAGDMGSGHSVTALYELIPVGVESPYLKTQSELKYQKTTELTDNESDKEWCTVRMRYKKPDSNKSEKIEKVVLNTITPLTNISDNFRLAMGVATFGVVLRQSEFKGQATYTQAIALLKDIKTPDTEGYRGELIRLINTAQALENVK